MGKCNGDGKEQRMVVLKKDDTGRPTVWCDPCISDLVKALNDGGCKTIASCCGHGSPLGLISLTDGRQLIIADNLELALKIVDLNNLSGAKAYECRMER